VWQPGAQSLGNGSSIPLVEEDTSRDARDGILQGTEFMTMVRDEDWKLVHFVDSPDGQLFDLSDDPDEVKNLWVDPQYSEKKSELLGVLRDWRISSGARTAPWSARWR